MTRTRPPVGHRPSLDRRRFLQAMTVAGVGLGATGLLGACGVEGTKLAAGECPSTDESAKDKRLNFSNWPEYIDVDDNGGMPSLRKFQRETGIKVTYNTDVNDNNDFFSKVKNQLGACEPVGRDIFVLTDWMAAKMINAGWIQKLDKSAMPEVGKQLVPTLQHPGWDENRDYSVPWQSGFTGIAYNAKYTKEVGSFEELVTRSDLKGKISLLTEMRDTMSFMLRLVDADPAKFGSDDWSNALDKLTSIVKSGQVRRFTGNDYVDDLNKGDLVACEAWSGDVIAMQYDNPDIKWVVPEEGLNIWSDNMLVPNLARHRANAEALMNFYYTPENAATLAAWVNYVCPVAGAQKAMEKIDKSLVEQPLIFPTEEFLSKASLFQAVSDGTSDQYERDFRRAITS